MKVAIPTDSNKVAPHFGRAPEYTIATIGSNGITSKKTIENPGHKPGFLPEFFNEKGIDVMIVKGIGRRAVSLFNQFDIDIVTGAEGNVDEVLEQFVEGELGEKQNPCRPGKGKGYGEEKQGEE